MKNMVIGFAIAFILYRMFARDTGTKKVSENTKVKGIGDEQDALTEISLTYGDELGRWVERIYRLETNNFKSGQYLYTGSPGMESHASAYPYGWTTPSVLWDDPALSWTRPVGFVTMKENQTGRQKTFLKFDSVLAGMVALAEYIQKYRPGRWYSTEVPKAEEYENKLMKIQPIYT